MYAAIIVVLAVLLLLFIGAFICYRMTFYTNRKRHYNPNRVPRHELDEVEKRTRALVTEFLKTPYERVQTRSCDGLSLIGKYYHQKDGAPLEICFNGYRSLVERDFSGGGKEALDMGHNLLLVDQRAHGFSDGRTITFGRREMRDVCSWVEYAKARFGGGVRIILAGVSMGASTVLMASDADFGGNVKGIVADCPFSSAKEIIKEVMRNDMKLPAAIFYPLVWLGGVIFGGFNANRAEAFSHVENSKIPILLLHGEGDDFVPIAMSEEIAKRGPTVRFHRFKDAGHGMSYVVHPDRYREILKDFYSEVL